jgi:hypothetical protein
MADRAVLARAALVAALVGAACSGAPSGYGKQSEAVFMRSCVQTNGQTAERLCRCSYDQIVKQIPYDRWKEIDRELRDHPDTVPSDLERIVVACAAEDDGTTTTSGGTTTTG